MLDQSATLISLKDGSILIGKGPYSTFSSLENIDPHKPVFYRQDFFLKNKAPWIQYAHWLVLTIDEFRKMLTEISFLEPIQWTIGHHDLFKETFMQLQHRLEASELKKAVPYTFSYTPQQMTTPRLQKCLHTALDYIQRYPGYLYGHWDETEGFLGVTPEILFTHHAQQAHTLHTMALAGTKKQAEAQAALEKNEKEQNEHRLVVQGIAETFQSLGTTSIGSTIVLDLPTLKHLLTPIEVYLKDPFHFESTVQAMHPTPALGAFPKVEGWKWLEAYQAKLDRKNFGAPFGVIFPNQGLSFCLVAIRQVQWSAQGMRMGAGCGVVKSSILAHEWDEIQLKIKAIRTFLSL